MADGPGAHIYLGPLERARIRFKHRRILGSDQYDLRVTFDEIVASSLWPALPPPDDMMGADEETDQSL